MKRDETKKNRRRETMKQKCPDLKSSLHIHLFSIFYILSMFHCIFSFLAKPFSCVDSFLSKKAQVELL